MEEFKNIYVISIIIFRERYVVCIFVFFSFVTQSVFS